MNLSAIWMMALISLSLIFLSFQRLSAQVLAAFPEAEGFGKFASGGRGGEVVEVLNLNDSGEGSLRWSLDQYPNAPITIVFRISGLIDLKTNIKINRSNITIAGQTAPGDGICLTGRSLIINGANGGKSGGNHGNIIIRYIRSRPGGTLATGLYGIDIENAHDIIVDHCSFSWANEECAALYDVKNITMQWCIISEGLYQAGHAKGNRSYGGVWGGQNASYHHNLISNQNSRTVRFNGARAHDTLAVIDYRNNVIYNWGSANACYGGEVEIRNGRSEINLVNNYYLPGPATSSDQKFVKANYNVEKAKGIGRWYIKGNVMEGNSLLTENNLVGVDLTELPQKERANMFVHQSFMYNINTEIKTQSAKEALKLIVQHSGASRPKRDDVDHRIMGYLKRAPQLSRGSFGKAGIVDNPADTGGWPMYNSSQPPLDKDHDGLPDSWEKKNGLNPFNASDRNLLDKNGYTMLEVYLNN